MVGLPPLLGFVAKEAALAAWSTVRRWPARRPRGRRRRLGADDGLLVRLWWGLFATKRRAAAPACTSTTGPGAGSSARWCSSPRRRSRAASSPRPSPTRLDAGGDVARRRARGPTSPCGPACTCRCCSRSLIVAAGGGPGRGRVCAADGWWADRADDVRRARLRPGLQRSARRRPAPRPVTQSGSLPVYIAVIFAVVVSCSASRSPRCGRPTGGDPVLADSVLQAFVAVLTRSCRSPSWPPAGGSCRCCCSAASARR